MKVITETSPDEGYYSNVSDEGYYSNVPDEGYCRNASCTLNLISLREEVFIHKISSTPPLGTEVHAPIQEKER